jgi:uncharacterized membrane protein YphA (DoxX/SURF4 family)
MNAAYWALRIMLGLGVLVAGADKFTNLLANWEAYLNPYVLRSLPIPAAQFMQIAGIVEIVVGLCILAGLSRVFGYIGMVWLWGIAANLISTHMFYDIAVRDILLGSAAYSLARLTEARTTALAAPHRDEYWRAA